MKRALAALMALSMAFSLAACGARPQPVVPRERHLFPLALQGMARLPRERC